jgi:threonine synthase
MLAKPPVVVGVQARGCNLVASAFREAKETINRVEQPHTIALAMTNPWPPSGAHVLRTLRRAGGLMLDVSDDEILMANRRCVSAHRLAGLEPGHHRAEG